MSANTSTKLERARRYVAKMPPAVEGNGGDRATYNVAVVLIRKFKLTVAEARVVLSEYNQRCEPQWSKAELEHKLLWVAGQLGDEQAVSGGASPAAGLRSIEFDPAKLAEISKPWREVADLIWLADRSTFDPATVSPGDFLTAVYPAGEQVLVFTDTKSQGEIVGPKSDPICSGRLGVYLLPQPVDGKFHPNPRSPSPSGRPKLSRRSEESVTSFRYLVLESDKADPRDWVGLLVQAPLRIEALYTSGSRSVHALVRVDCATKQEWDEKKRSLMPFFCGCVRLGADPGTLSAVRLTRLPGCYREGKLAPDGTYTRFASPRLQKLLFLRPGADGTPICKLPAVRNVRSEWLGRAVSAIKTSSTDIFTAERALKYYAGNSDLKGFVCALRTFLAEWQPTGPKGMT